MFDMGIGMGEMLFVAVIALIVLGPEKFPDYAKLFIRASRDLRGYFNEIKTEIAKEVNPIKKEIDTLSRQDPEKLIDALAGTSASDEGEYGRPPAGDSSGSPKTDTDTQASGVPNGGVMEGAGAAYTTENQNAPSAPPFDAAASAGQDEDDPYDFEKNPPPERLD